MTRRDVLTLFAGAAAFACAPSLAGADEPIGLLGLIDDSTYAPVVYAQTRLSGASVRALSVNKARLAAWLADEQARLERDASEQYGRPIRFEALEFDGQRLTCDPGQDVWRVVYVERPS